MSKNLPMLWHIPLSHFNEKVRWALDFKFREDPDLALRVLMTGMPDAAYRNLRRLGRIFRAYYRFRHKIKEQRLQQDRADVADALDRISRELQPSGYLVGEAFSVADLTAAAMLD